MPGGEPIPLKPTPKATRSASQPVGSTKVNKAKTPIVVPSLKTLHNKTPPDGGLPPVPKTEEPNEYINNRIYISNIPFSLRESDLVDLFSPYGQVYSAMIVTNDRGSKGFGFVTLDSVESCERAKLALNGRRILGRVIEVRRATCPPRGRRFQMNNGRIVGAVPLQPTPSHRAVSTMSPISQDQAFFKGNLTPTPRLQTPLSDALSLQTILGMQPLFQLPPAFPVYQPISATDILDYSFGASAQSFGALPNTAPPAHFYSAYSLGAVLPGTFNFPVLAPNCQVDLRGNGPLSSGLANSTITNSCSPNNSFMNTSMIAHVRLMQDQLVNMLNLDGTLNQSFIAALNNTLGHDHNRSLNCSSKSTGSEEGSSMESRKRPACESAKDDTPAKRLEG